MALTKIVSGGETGVDRAALDAALATGFPCGGWVPGDRSAEDGTIAMRYPLTPLPKGGTRQRTRLNVVDSDGSVIFFHELLKGGARLTRNLCALEKRPYLLVDAHKSLEARAAARDIVEFVQRHSIRVLNVSGPRASRWPPGYEFVFAAMSECIQLAASASASASANQPAEEALPPH
jgi:putative molybdenum carrier protein